jgi:glycosyltransferase involved in cell wall biosynthesis
MLPDDTRLEAIIPARGPTPWLRLSLSSIAAQTLQPVAVTLVDDGLENTSEVQNLGAKLFAERFRMLKNEGRGISAALNTGIRNSSAAWIARMDADDIAHPDRFKLQLNFLSGARSDVLGCGTQVRFINPQGRVLEYSRLPSSWEKISKQMFRKTCFVHSTLMIRRDILSAISYRSAMDGAEDVDLLLRLAEKGKILNMEQALLDYRLHLSQESFRTRARQTAVQELAFRLAQCRRQKRIDPLEADPELAERFIRWRLSTPGYVRSRTFLTALRYMKTYLAGADLGSFLRCALVGMKSLPVNGASVHIALRVLQKAGAGLVDSKTPFESLNVT